MIDAECLHVSGRSRLGVRSATTYFTQALNIDEYRPPPRLHSGEDARVPAVETTALLTTEECGRLARGHRGVPPRWLDQGRRADVAVGAESRTRVHAGGRENRCFGLSYEDRSKLREIYRQLYSMRSRLNGSLIAFRFAAIELSYMEATRATASPATPSQIEEQRKVVEVATLRVVHDRTELESLLGWIDLSAPPDDHRWGHAIQSLIRLDRWSPAPTGTTNSLPAWKEAERMRAYQLCTTEINAKFAELLILLRENRRELARQAAGPQ